jgi:hypothetical protein
VKFFQCHLVDEMQLLHSLVSESRRGKFHLVWVTPLEIKARKAYSLFIKLYGSRVLCKADYNRL